MSCTMLYLFRTLRDDRGAYLILFSSSSLFLPYPCVDIGWDGSAASPPRMATDPCWTGFEGAPSGVTSLVRS